MKAISISRRYHRTFRVKDIQRLSTCSRRHTTEGFARFAAMTKRAHTRTHTRAATTTATTMLACIHYTTGVAETYKRNRRISKLLLNRFWANITRGGSGRFAMPGSDGASGSEEDEEVKEQRGVWADKRGMGTARKEEARREGEIGAERRRQEPRARKPFGKFHNRTCRICPDYFNIFDSSRESVCERVYAWMELAAAVAARARTYARLCVGLYGRGGREWVRGCARCTRVAAV